MTVFFIGSPDDQEQQLLPILQQKHHVITFTNSAEVYQCIAYHFPDIVIFATNVCDTESLKLFRRLRRIGRISVIVCSSVSMEGLSGRNYSRRRHVSKQMSGLLDLLEWIDRSQVFHTTTGQGSMLALAKPGANSPSAQHSSKRPRFAGPFWLNLFAQGSPA